MDDGMLNIEVFLGLKKAFDTVNHEILIGKLSFFGMQTIRLQPYYLIFGKSYSKVLCKLISIQTSKNRLWSPPRVYFGASSVFNLHKRFAKLY